MNEEQQKNCHLITAIVMNLKNRRLVVERSRIFSLNFRNTIAHRIFTINITLLNYTNMFLELVRKILFLTT